MMSPTGQKRSPGWIGSGNQRKIESFSRPVIRRPPAAVDSENENVELQPGSRFFPYYLQFFSSRDAKFFLAPKYKSFTKRGLLTNGLNPTDGQAIRGNKKKGTNRSQQRSQRL